MLADSISDLLYVSDPAGMQHLAREGVPDENIVFVGNVMIDTLLRLKERALASSVLEDLGVREGEFGLVTLHRPSNVDDRAMLEHLLAVLGDIAQELPLVFPVHPRTKARMEAAGIALAAPWILSPPLGYLGFMKLTATARVVLTDSGGIQEETTVLGVPCVTLRDNTERPVTVEEGTNFLAGTSREAILTGFRRAMAGDASGRVPRFWDGKSAARVAEHLVSVLG